MIVTLPYPPSVNNLYATVRGRRVLSRAGRNYHETASLAAMRAGAIYIDGPVTVTVDVYRPRKAGDLDNTLKVVLDSLTGTCWHDDRQVEEIHARRFDDKHNPRVVVDVQPFEVNRARAQNASPK